MHIAPSDHGTDGIELSAGGQFPFARNAIFGQHRYHFIEVSRAPPLALQYKHVLGMACGDQAVSRSNSIVARRAA